MVTVLMFLGGIVFDIFLFVMGIRLVKIGFRWTKTLMNRIADSVDEKIANGKLPSRKEKREAIDTTGSVK